MEISTAREREGGYLESYAATETVAGYGQASKQAEILRSRQMERERRRRNRDARIKTVLDSMFIDANPCPKPIELNDGVLRGRTLARLL